MGDGYEFVCDSCGDVEDITLGAVMVGPLAAFYCEECGRVDNRAVSIELEPDELDRLMRAQPCPRHPDSPMLELTEKSVIPCPSCGDGRRRADPRWVIIAD
jgi:uncharacterized Zn finger protein